MGGNKGLLCILQVSRCFSPAKQIFAREKIDKNSGNQICISEQNESSSKINICLAEDLNKNTF